MFQLKLFLGIPSNEALQKELARANPCLRSLFMGGGDYLTEITHSQQRYIGKPIPLSIPVNQLENLEEHILSLLRKLTPEYAFSKNPPVLVTYLDDDPCA